MIETKRLLLRKPVPDDFPRFWEMMTDPVAKQYTGGVTQLPYAERLALFQEECTADFTPECTEFAVIEKQSGLYIGYCGFRYSETLQDNEFLYGFCTDSWGKGYATEAAHAVLQFLFKTYPFDSYCSTVHPQNTASRKVLEKTGFLEAGSVRVSENEIDVLYRRRK